MGDIFKEMNYQIEIDMKRPNILFLFTDDQRFDTIRALGNEQIHTPNLDYLVENGTAFTQAAIMGGTSPAVCMPSRAMMLTGRTLFHIDGRGESIPVDHMTLPEHYRQVGYETFGTGKWHNGTESYARSFDRGAEIFFGGMDDHWNVPACDFANDGNYPAPRPRPIRWLPWELSETERRFDHISPGQHSTELFASAACDFLRNHNPLMPFFAYVSFMAPHDPRTMPQEYRDMYDPAEMLLPPNLMAEHPFDNGALDLRDEKLAARPRQSDEIRRHLADYYGMITHLDAQIGRILEALREIGEFKNTIVVLAGDNGLALGQHGLMGKQNLYDHSVRVPLVMMGPEISAGERRDVLCYLIDIYPTICELTGHMIPQSVEGLSLGPALADTAVSHRTHLRFAYTDLQRGVMDGRYKLIEYVLNDRFTTQLFDLRQDPWELNNLSNDHAYASTLARLRQELVKWRTEMDDWGELFWNGYKQEEVIRAKGSKIVSSQLLSIPTLNWEIHVNRNFTIFPWRLANRRIWLRSLWILLTRWQRTLIHYLKGSELVKFCRGNWFSDNTTTVVPRNNLI